MIPGFDTVVLRLVLVIVRAGEGLYPLSPHTAAELAIVVLVLIVGLGLLAVGTAVVLVSNLSGRQTEWR